MDDLLSYEKVLSRCTELETKLEQSESERKLSEQKHQQQVKELRKDLLIEQSKVEKNTIQFNEEVKKMQEQYQELQSEYDW